MTAAQIRALAIACTLIIVATILWVNHQDARTGRINRCVDRLSSVGLDSLCDD